jgi:hypothetical protein
MADAVNRFLPWTKVKYSGNGEADRRDYNVSFSKFVNSFGDNIINWSLHSGVAELFGAIQTRGLNAGEFKGNQANRLNGLKQLLDEGKLDESMRWIQ